MKMSVAYFCSLIESPSYLMKDDIANDLSDLWRSFQVQ